MEPWLVLAGALGGGAITAAVREWFARSKTGAEAEKAEAEAADVLTKAATDLLLVAIGQADANEKRLIARIDELESKVDHLGTAVEVLSAQLRAAGLEPQVPPSPPPWRYMP